jgi:hypothetical protein
MLFREIIAVYFENHTQQINTLCGQNAVIECSCRWYIKLPLGFKGVKTGLLNHVRPESQSSFLMESNLLKHPCSLLKILRTWAYYSKEAHIILSLLKKFL